MESNELTITIKTDNAAFEGDCYGPEIARILRDIAMQHEQGLLDRDMPLIIRDINGNAVGLLEHN